MRKNKEVIDIQDKQTHDVVVEYSNGEVTIKTNETYLPINIVNVIINKVLESILDHQAEEDSKEITKELLTNEQSIRINKLKEQLTFYRFATFALAIWLLIYAILQIRG